MESLEKEADSLLLEAEKKNFQTLSEAYALRAWPKSVGDEQLTMVDKSLSHLEKELKITGGFRGRSRGPQPLTPKNDVPASKFYKIEVLEWQF